jgi:hypothetical protein
MLEQVISMNNYKEHISSDPNITNDIRRKCREKLENIQHITSEYRALVQVDYTNRNSHVADISHQELVIKCGLTYYKHEPQPELENSKSYTVVWQVHNNWSKYP